MAITVTGSGTSSNVNVASFNTVSIAPSGQRLVLLFVTTVQVGGVAAVPTASGNSLTYVEIANVAIPGDERRITVFRAQGAGATTGQVTIDCGGVSQSWIGYTIILFEGDIAITGSNGEDAVLQWATDVAVSPDQVVGPAVATNPAFGTNRFVTGAIRSVNTNGIFSPNHTSISLGIGNSTVGIRHQTAWRTGTTNLPSFTIDSGGDGAIVTVEIGLEYVVTPTGIPSTVALYQPWIGQSTRLYISDTWFGTMQADHLLHPFYADVFTPKGEWDFDSLDTTGAADIAFFSTWKRNAGGGSGASVRTFSEAVATAPYARLAIFGTTAPLGEQTIEGEFNVMFMVRESNADADFKLRIHIWVAGTGGDTLETDIVRGTLLDKFVDSSELPTTLVGARLFAGWQTLTPVEVLAGDRIVIEIGYLSENVHTTSRNMGILRGVNPLGMDVYEGFAGAASEVNAFVEFTHLIQWHPAPTNDWCATAHEITLFPFEEVIDVRAATESINDVSVSVPLGSCSESGWDINDVWWVFTAPENGAIFFFVSEADFPVILTVWNTGDCGEEVNFGTWADRELGCKLDPTENDPLSVEVVAGQQYLVVVQQHTPFIFAKHSRVTFHAQYLPPADAATNTDCTLATEISHVPYTNYIITTAVPDDATTPVSSCTGARKFNPVWYEWECTRSGNYTFDTRNSSYETVVTVFEGSCIALTEVACDQGAPASVTFAAVNGLTYFFMVESFEDGGGWLRVTFVGEAVAVVVEQDPEVLPPGPYGGSDGWTATNVEVEEGNANTGNQALCGVNAVLERADIDVSETQEGTITLWAFRPTDTDKGVSVTVTIPGTDQGEFGFYNIPGEDIIHLFSGLTEFDAPETNVYESGVWQKFKLEWVMSSVSGPGQVNSDGCFRLYVNDVLIYNVPFRQLGFLDPTWYSDTSLNTWAGIRIEWTGCIDDVIVINSAPDCIGLLPGCVDFEAGAYWYDPLEITNTSEIISPWLDTVQGDLVYSRELNLEGLSLVPYARWSCDDFVIPDNINQAQLYYYDPDWPDLWVWQGANDTDIEFNNILQGGYPDFVFYLQGSGGGSITIPFTGGSSGRYFWRPYRVNASEYYEVVNCIPFPGHAFPPSTVDKGDSVCQLPREWSVGGPIFYDPYNERGYGVYSDQAPNRGNGVWRLGFENDSIPDPRDYGYNVNGMPRFRRGNGQLTPRSRAFSVEWEIIPTSLAFIKEGELPLLQIGYKGGGGVVDVILEIGISITADYEPLPDSQITCRPYCEGFGFSGLPQEEEITFKGDVYIRSYPDGTTRYAPGVLTTGLSVVSAFAQVLRVHGEFSSHDGASFQRDGHYQVELNDQIISTSRHSVFKDQFIHLHTTSGAVADYAGAAWDDVCWYAWGKILWVRIGEALCDVPIDVPDDTVCCDDGQEWKKDNFDIDSLASYTTVDVAHHATAGASGSGAVVAVEAAALPSLEFTQVQQTRQFSVQLTMEWGALSFITPIIALQRSGTPFLSLHRDDANLYVSAAQDGQSANAAAVAIDAAFHRVEISGLTSSVVAGVFQADAAYQVVVDGIIYIQKNNILIHPVDDSHNGSFGNFDSIALSPQSVLDCLRVGQFGCEEAVAVCCDKAGPGGAPVAPPAIGPGLDPPAIILPPIVIPPGGDDPPAVYSPCEGGGQPATAVDPADVQAMATATVPLVSIEWTLADGTIRKIAKLPIQKPGEPRAEELAVTFSPISYQLADHKGNLETQSYSVGLNDSTGEIKQMLAEGANRYIIGRRMTGWIEDDAARRAGTAPRRLFSGVITNYPELTEDLVLNVPVSDELGYRYSPFSLDRQMPYRTLRPEMFPNLPAQHQGLPVPIIYGEMSDESRINDPEPYNIPYGILPTIYLGTRSLTPLGGGAAEDWDAFLVCGHAIKSINAWFGSNLTATNLGSVRMAESTAGAGGTFLIPGYANWDLYFTTPYNDILDSNGVTERFTIIYAQGSVADAAVGGSVPITINACGTEDIGDGSGNLITDIAYQVLHFLAYWVLPEISYRTGLWGDIPTYPTGNPKISTPSVEAVKNIHDARLPNGYPGAWALHTQAPARNVLADIQLSGGFRLGLNHHGQVIAFTLDHEADITGLTEISDTDDFIDENSFRVTPRVDELENVISYIFGPEPATGRFTGPKQFLADTLSITNYLGERRSHDLIFNITRSAAVADNIAYHHLLWTANTPTYVTFSMSLAGLDLRLGQLIRLTHRAGLGLTGWHSHILLVTGITVNPEETSFMVQIFCEDVHHIVAERNLGFGGENPLPSGAALFIPGGLAFAVTSSTVTSSATLTAPTVQGTEAVTTVHIAFGASLFTVSVDNAGTILVEFIASTVMLFGADVDNGEEAVETNVIPSGATLFALTATVGDVGVSAAAIVTGLTLYTATVALTGDEWAASISTVGTDATESTGTALTAPGSTNTKSAWVELTPSTPVNAWAFVLHIGFRLAVGTGLADTLVDIGIGGSGAETVLLANVPASLTGVRTGIVQVLVPLEIAAGTRLSARLQSSDTDANVIGVSIHLLEKSSRSGATAAQTYGANTTDSGGVPVDPGGTADTKGAWSEVTASTTADINWLIICIGNQNLASRSTSANWAFDVGIGAAGFETVVIPDLLMGASSTSDAPYARSFAIPVPTISSGTRIAVRAQCSTDISPSRLFDVVLIGLNVP